MAYRQRLCELQALLTDCRGLWHPQPFREPRPDWCRAWPGLAEELLALPDEVVERLNDEGAAARQLLARHFPRLRACEAWLDLPHGHLPESLSGERWAWGIPGRKRAQIESFAGAVRPAAKEVLEWCAGKGHLGRLLALRHGLTVNSLEINGELRADGAALARRAGVAQRFVAGDALTFLVPENCHALALHACGELHRSLLRQASRCAALDIAPCCYYHGVEACYAPMSSVAGLHLTRDDVRLAVTETVTASPRQARQRDREMAWKLGFDGLRRQQGAREYQTFKPVPPAWMRGDFAAFCGFMAEREGLNSPSASDIAALEKQGWQRQREVMRLSIVRHVFRRLLELWLLLDMAVFLEEQGWQVALKTFCSRQWTPRNVLISARR